MDVKDNPRRRLEANSVAEQATEWLMKLEDDGAEANPAFAEWLRESPTHVQVYLRAATLDTMLRRVDPDRSIEVAKPVPGERVPDIEPGYTGRKPHRLWQLAASVAAIGVLSAAAWLTWELTNDGWKTYRTDIGEQRTVQLSDGSTMTLNTDSRIQVRFTEGERELRLMDGEAVFRVERDRSRPFRVRSGDSIVQAIGTEFNVYRKLQETTVSVLEGRVAVIPASAAAAATAVAGGAPAQTQPLYLEAGEELRLNARGAEPRKSSANVQKVTAWREHRLVFVDEPLGEIAYEVNRYNRSPKIRVEGVAAQRRYAVSLKANDPESLVVVLAGDPRVTVERRNGEILVQDR